MGLWGGKPEDGQLSEAYSREPDEKRNQSPLDRLGKVYSALSAGTKIEGKLTFDKPVRIDGELKGEVHAPDVVVVVGAEGKVDGQIEAAALVVFGQVRGTVKASQSTELLAGSSVTGDIDTQALIVQAGSFFNGKCKMPEHQPAQPNQTEQKRQGPDSRSERDQKGGSRDDSSSHKTAEAASLRTDDQPSPLLS